MHIGVFILLLLSGERNFGVRLNKPYVLRVPMDIPVFTGTHADLLIVVKMSANCDVYKKIFSRLPVSQNSRLSCNLTVLFRFSIKSSAAGISASSLSLTVCSL